MSQDCLVWFGESNYVSWGSDVSVYYVYNIWSCQYLTLRLRWRFAPPHPHRTSRPLSALVGIHSFTAAFGPARTLAASILRAIHHPTSQWPLIVSLQLFRAGTILLWIEKVSHFWWPGHSAAAGCQQCPGLSEATSYPLEP